VLRVQEFKFFLNILTPEDETTILSQNFGHKLSSDVAPHPRKMETAAVVLQMSENLNGSFLVCKT
jgi:hypothetical protein